MKSKKFATAITMILAAILSLSVFSLAGCTKKDKIIRDGKTVNVRTFRAGYGIEWAYELKQKFESAYKEEGYKINILTPSSDMRGGVALNDMALGNAKTGVDLYLVSGITADQVGSLGDYGILAEDIEETVYKQKPIGYDGNEEENTVKDKIHSEMEPFLRDSAGVMYGFNWSTASGGLAVNTKKLAKYGDLKLPKTTNEMFAVFDEIYKTSKQTSIYPVTYVAGTNGYVNCALAAWHAQYDRADFDRFWSMSENGQDMVENGYEVFDGKALESMLSIGYHAMDWKIAASGSTTQELDQAQSQIMDNNRGAVFMFNGDWMLNEVRANYPNELDNIEFMNVPVNSALGEKLFGEGTKYNLSASEADQLLSAIIEKVDANLEVSQIAQDLSAYGLDEADALTVAKARGLTYCRGVENLAYIAKGSPVKDIAALVLRMMASDDYEGKFANKANCATPYAYAADITSNYKFVRQSFAIVRNRYYNLVSNYSNGLRKKLGINTYFTNVTHLPSKMYGSNVTMYDGRGGIGQDEAGRTLTTEVYENAAKTLLQSARAYTEEKWNNYLTSAGLKQN